MNNQKIENEFKTYGEECPEVKTVVHWYDLYEGHTVQVEPTFFTTLLESSIQKAETMSALGSCLGISRKTVSALYHRKVNPSIKTLKKLAQYANYSINDVENKIIRVANLKPNLPFKLNNSEGAEIRAAFISDGHIDKQPFRSAQYCALEKELHKRLIVLCKNVFGEFMTKTRFNSKSHITRFPPPIGNALEQSGIPRGKKLFHNFYLPKDILESTVSIQSAYLRRAFDDEGDVCFDKHGKRAVRLTRSVDIGKLGIDILPERWVRYKLSPEIRHNLIKGEQLLLLKLGIDARLYPEGIYLSKNNNLTAKWRIQVAQQDHLKTFSNIINFNLSSKRKKLATMLNSYQIRKRPNGEGKNETLQIITNIFKNKGFFTYGDVAKEMIERKFCYDSAGQHLHSLLQDGTIKKIRRGVYTLDRT